MSNMIDTHLVEIRFKPNAKMLDYRGAWADAISTILDYDQWRVEQTRIDIWDNDNRHNAFVSFKNAGFAVRNVATKGYFPDHAIKFLKLLFEFEGFGSAPFIERIGVRSRFCTPFKSSFNDLIRKYTSNYILLSEPAKDALNAEILDVGTPLVLKDDIGNINLMGGPMETPQIIKFFGISNELTEELPKVGLVFDIDYWDKPKSEMSLNELLATFKKFSSACWSLHDRLQKLVLQ